MLCIGVFSCYNHAMNMDAIALTPDQIKAFCQKYHIHSLAFFGSVVRDDFRPDSDVDVLVEFDPAHIPGFQFFTIQAELSRLIGRRVDLQTKSFLSAEVRQTALEEAVVAYEQT